MAQRILVAYGSKYGATREIAEKISETLRDAGLEVEVLPADRAGDPSSYKAVVLGSAVYAGRWRKEAARFLQANEGTLAKRPVWIFSSGPTGEGDPLELVKGWRLPDALKPVADRIKPRDITVFHGAMDPGKLNFFEKLILKMVKAPTGDFRDWDTIAAWASGIARDAA